MFGSAKRHLYRDPVKKFFYGLMGIPRIAEQNRARRVLRTIRKTNLAGRPKILDAGFGDGFYSLWLAKQFPFAEITAIDNDKKNVKNLEFLVFRENLVNINVIHCDLTKIDFQSSFDLILCIDVLEHIEDDEKVLNNFFRALKPQSWLIIHVPQVNQKFLFTKRNFGCGREHVREGYSQAGITSTLIKRGLELVKTEISFSPFASLAVEIDEAIWRTKFYLLWLAIYPILYIIGWIDSVYPVTKGQGFLIVAKKQ